MEQQYERIAKVGEGTYGVVYMARHRPTGLVCAIKKIRLHAGGGAAMSPDDEEGVPATAIREVSCLREIHAPWLSPPSSDCDDDGDELSGPMPSSSKLGRASLAHRYGLRGAEHVVKLLDVMHDDQRLHLVFEYVECDLKKYMDRYAGARAARRAAKDARDTMVGLGISVDGRGDLVGDEFGGDAEVEWDGEGLPPAQVKSLTYQMMLGLSHLHSRRMLHRDLKPQNLLVAPTGFPAGKEGGVRGGPLLKIADFGLARTFGVPVKSYTHEVITLFYRPPEVLLGGRHYTTAVDMWSVGCIMAEMSSGKSLFTGDSEFGQIIKIFQVLGTPDETCWPGVNDLPDWNASFPTFRSQDLRSKVLDLPFSGLDLLAGCLIYNPSLRASAKDALTHPFLRFPASRQPSPSPPRSRSMHHGSTIMQQATPPTAGPPTMSRLPQFITSQVVVTDVDQFKSTCSVPTFEPITTTTSHNGNAAGGFTFRKVGQSNLSYSSHYGGVDPIESSPSGRFHLGLEQAAHQHHHHNSSHNAHVTSMSSGALMSSPNFTVLEDFPTSPSTHHDTFCRTSRNNGNGNLQVYDTSRLMASPVI